MASSSSSSSISKLISIIKPALIDSNRTNHQSNNCNICHQPYKILGQRNQCIICNIGACENCCRFHCHIEKLSYGKVCDDCVCNIVIDEDKVALLKKGLLSSTTWKYVDFLPSSLYSITLHLTGLSLKLPELLLSSSSLPNSDQRYFFFTITCGTKILLRSPPAYMDSLHTVSWNDPIYILLDLRNPWSTHVVFEFYSSTTNILCNTIPNQPMTLATNTMNAISSSTTGNNSIHINNTSNLNGIHDISNITDWSEKYRLSVSELFQRYSHIQPITETVLTGPYIIKPKNRISGNIIMNVHTKVYDIGTLAKMYKPDFFDITISGAIPWLLIEPKLIHSYYNVPLVYLYPETSYLFKELFLLKSKSKSISKSMDVQLSEHKMEGRMEKTDIPTIHSDETRNYDKRLLTLRLASALQNTAFAITNRIAYSSPKSKSTMVATSSTVLSTTLSKAKQVDNTVIQNSIEPMDVIPSNEVIISVVDYVKVIIHSSFASSTSTSSTSPVSLSNITYPVSLQKNTSNNIDSNISSSGGSYTTSSTSKISKYGTLLLTSHRLIYIRNIIEPMELQPSQQLPYVLTIPIYDIHSSSVIQQNIHRDCCTGELQVVCLSDDLVYTFLTAKQQHRSAQNSSDLSIPYLSRSNVSNSNVNMMFEEIVSLRMFRYICDEITWRKEEDKFSLSPLSSVLVSTRPSSSSSNDSRQYPRHKTFNILDEYQRQGIGIKNKNWRISSINQSYTLCKTYPKYLVTPACIKDTTLDEAASTGRSRNRLPVLTWMHPSGNALFRCSQPMGGVWDAVNPGDETLLLAIRSSVSAAGVASTIDSGIDHSIDRGIDQNIDYSSEWNTDKGLTSRRMRSYTMDDDCLMISTASDGSSKPLISTATTTITSSSSSNTHNQSMAIAIGGPSSNSCGNSPRKSLSEKADPISCSPIIVEGIMIPKDFALQSNTIYGSIVNAKNSSKGSKLNKNKKQPMKCIKLRICDARPLLNASMNMLAGKGFENISRLGGSSVASRIFLGMENIHVMSKSYKDYKAMCLSQLNSSTPFAHPSSYQGCDWLQHISEIIRGSVYVALQLEVGHPVVVHCSDGWDRTSIVCALSQVLLDPYYRTIDGLITLIEKDFIEFGHQFRCRSDGTLSLPKNIAQSTTSQNNHITTQNISIHTKDLSEISPIFLQFLDALWQIWRQYPNDFEYNDKLLLLYVQMYRTAYIDDFKYNSVYDRLHDYLDIQRSLFGSSAENLNVDSTCLWHDKEKISDIIDCNRNHYNNPLNTIAVNMKHTNGKDRMECKLLVPLWNVLAMGMWIDAYSVGSYPKLNISIPDHESTKISTQTMGYLSKLKEKERENILKKEQNRSIHLDRKIYKLLETLHLHDEIYRREDMTNNSHIHGTGHDGNAINRNGSEQNDIDGKESIDNSQAIPIAQDDWDMLESYDIDATEEQGEGEIPEGGDEEDEEVDGDADEEDGRDDSSDIEPTI